jgi:hypothetical protein
MAQKWTGIAHASHSQYSQSARLLALDSPF